jgi:lipopolysaccharide transport system permease protein
MESKKRQRLLEHRELLIRFTSRQIERQTKGSWLGTLWVLVNPLLMLGLYTFVFGMIMGGNFNVTPNPGPFDYPLGIFIGLTVMGLVTETMGQSPTIILSHQNLVKKVVFPLHLLPMASVGSIFFKTSMSCLLAGLFVIIAGNDLTWDMLWFPIILFPVLLCAMGIAWLLSALGVYFRDSQQLMAFFATALFYGSAVFYPSKSIPEGVYAYLRFNPVLHAIELSRDVLLWNIPLDFLKLAYLYGCGGMLFLLGLFTFQALRSGFADVL